MFIFIGCSSGKQITSGTVIFKVGQNDFSDFRPRYWITFGKVVNNGDGTFTEKTREIEVDKETYDKYKIGDHFSRYPEEAEKNK